jgi:hypothetical protein
VVVPFNQPVALGVIRSGDQMVGLQGFIQILCERGGQALSSIGNEGNGRSMLKDYITYKEVDDFFSGGFRDGLDDSPFGQIVHGDDSMFVSRSLDGERAYQVYPHLFERLISSNRLQ